MKNIAIFSAIMTVLLGIDGIYMIATHYKKDDVNNFHLSDGGTVLVAALILLVLTIIAFTKSSKSHSLDK